MSFGILTLATPNDYIKAIGLALSVRASNPGVPIAVACSEKVRPLVDKYFDIIVPEDPTLRGFEHKVHLDRYTPFDETFFFDSDVLVFRPLSEILELWRGQAYVAWGVYGSDGFSSFGLDRARVLQKIGKDRLVLIDGAGHAYFKKPDCQRVFDLSREITAQYAEYGGPIRFADEDVLDIAMTILDYQPQNKGEFFSRHLSAKRGTLKMDATKARCEFIAADTGLPYHPVMMHFAMNEAPFTYAGQLSKLFRKHGVSTKGIWSTAFEDFFTNNIAWPIKGWIKRLVGPKKATHG